MWTDKYDAKSINREDIPKEIGLYAWFSKNNGELVYIGKATGNGGLRRRIWSQHLNPKYLESRNLKFSAKDNYQLCNPVLVNNRIVIDKSAFRKNVSRYYSLKAGIESVEFIKEHFMIAFESFEDSDKLKVIDLEKQLILDLKPKFIIALL